MSDIKDVIEQLGLSDTAGFKNLIAIRDYVVKTREMFRLLQEENKVYKEQVQQQSLAIEQLRKQIQDLQVKMYSRNSTT